MAKTFYIENLGCFKNQVDAEYMITALQDKGYARAETAAGAVDRFLTTGDIEP